MKVKTTKKPSGSAVQETQNLGNVESISMDLIDVVTNFRTSFVDTETQELADNLKQRGLIHAILVRPLPNDRYQLVAGNRRYNATLLNGDSYILATVKEMTDEEVIEYQISENIQRVDVKPLQEADALKSYFDRGLSIEDIALKLGKSVSYIQGRIQLLQLIEPLQNLLDADQLPLSHAVYIARHDAIDQELFFKHLSGSGFSALGSVKETKRFFDNHIHSVLDGAQFPLDSSDILPNVPACVNCSQNTACSGLLFQDNVQPTCLKRSCFNAKTIQWRLLSILSMPAETVFFHAQYPWDVKQEDTNLINALLLADPDFTINNHDIIEKDSKIEKPVFDEEKPNADDFEDQAEFAEELENYSDYELAFHAEETEFQKELSTGKYIKGVYLSGSSRLKEFYFVRKSVKQTADSGDNGAESNPVIDQLMAEREKRVAKLARGLELDEEKIHIKRVANLKQTKAYQIKEIDKQKDLTEVENNAILYFLYCQMSYEALKVFNDKFKVSYQTSDSDKYEMLCNLSQEAKNYIYRQVINKNVFGLYPSGVTHFVTCEIGKIYSDEIGLDTILSEQKAIREKREKSANEKIELVDLAITKEKEKVVPVEKEQNLIVVEEVSEEAEISR